PLRQTKDQIHVVLDNQQCEVGRQAFDYLDYRAAFARRNPGCRLVEQQDLGREGECYRDLDQPLAAVGEGVDRTQCLVSEPELLDQREALLDCRTVPPRGAEKTAADTLPFANCQGHIFEDVEAAEQRRDLKRADKTALDPRGLRQTGNVGALYEDMPGIRRQPAGHQLDKASLAGAVRPDQRVARAAFQAE